ncbi:MAG: hypothetical protein RLZZ367_719 [Bacteroidota bacterium]|jgi:hypothetical protein
MEYYKVLKGKSEIILEKITEEKALEETSFIRILDRKNSNGSIREVDIIFEGRSGFFILGNFTVNNLSLFVEEKTIYALVKDGNDQFLNYRYCKEFFTGNNAGEIIAHLLNVIAEKTKGKAEWREIKDDFFLEQVKARLIIDWAGRAFVFPEE